MAVTFAALTVLPLLYLAQVGCIVAIGVLIDTILVRPLLVPALILDLGHRTWWPTRFPSDVSCPDTGLGLDAGAPGHSDRFRAVKGSTETEFTLSELGPIRRALAAECRV